MFGNVRVTGDWGVVVGDTVVEICWSGRTEALWFQIGTETEGHTGIRSRNGETRTEEWPDDPEIRLLCSTPSLTVHGSPSSLQSDVRCRRRRRVGWGGCRRQSLDEGVGIVVVQEREDSRPYVCTSVGRGRPSLPSPPSCRISF